MVIIAWYNRGDGALAQLPVRAACCELIKNKRLRSSQLNASKNVYFKITVWGISSVG